MGKTLNLIFILILCYGCIEPQINWGEREQVSGDDLQLFSVLYEGCPAPPVVTVEDYYDRLVLLQNNDFYTKLIDTFIFGREELKGYAVADFDGDRISNWEIAPGLMTIKPNDDDIDGDGAINLLDAHPYDKTITNQDNDGDGIVDHLDWSYSLDNEELIKIQEKVWQEYGIILYNTDARFSIETARAVDFSLSQIFHNYIKSATTQMVKYINVSLGINRYGHKRWAQGTFHPVELDITLYSREYESSEVFMLITHELGHALQFHLRDKDSDPVYEQFLSRHWDNKHFNGAYPGESIKLMHNSVRSIYRILDKNALTEDGRQLRYTYSLYALENNIISEYALKNPDEYFAESIAAYSIQLAIEAGYLTQEEVKNQIDFNPYALSAQGFSYIFSLLQ